MKHTNKELDEALRMMAREYSLHGCSSCSVKLCEGYHSMNRIDCVKAIIEHFLAKAKAKAKK